MQRNCIFKDLVKRSIIERKIEHTYCYCYYYANLILEHGATESLRRWHWMPNAFTKEAISRYSPCVYYGDTGRQGE